MHLCLCAQMERLQRLNLKPGAPGQAAPLTNPSQGKGPACAGKQRHSSPCPRTPSVSGTSLRLPMTLARAQQR